MKTQNASLLIIAGLLGGSMVSVAGCESWHKSLPLDTNGSAGHSPSATSNPNAGTAPCSDGSGRTPDTTQTNPDDSGDGIPKWQKMGVVRFQIWGPPVSVSSTDALEFTVADPHTRDGNATSFINDLNLDLLEADGSSLGLEPPELILDDSMPDDGEEFLLGGTSFTFRYDLAEESPARRQLRAAGDLEQFQTRYEGRVDCGKSDDAGLLSTSLYRISKSGGQCQPSLQSQCAFAICMVAAAGPPPGPHFVTNNGCSLRVDF